MKEPYEPQVQSIVDQMTLVLMVTCTRCKDTGVSEDVDDMGVAAGALIKEGWKTVTKPHSTKELLRQAGVDVSKVADHITYLYCPRCSGVVSR